jgi:hypothetical protein
VLLGHLLVGKSGAIIVERERRQLQKRGDSSEGSKTVQEKFDINTRKLCDGADIAYSSNTKVVAAPAGSPNVVVEANRPEYRLILVHGRQL